MSEGKVRALIVDDERPARRKVRRFLAEDPDIEGVGEAESGDQAIRATRAHRPDLLFLDVQMPGINGFGVVDALSPDLLPEVVFVTAHDQYALQAFEVGALDYLLKPFDLERFQQAVERAKASIRSGEAADLQDMVLELIARVERHAAGVEHLLIKTRDRAVLVPTREITWIQAAANYVELHAAERVYLLRDSLEGFLRQLSDRPFLRVHRSFIVNLDHIREIQPWSSHGDHVIFMKDGAKIRLSRRYRKKLPEPFRKHL